MATSVIPDEGFLKDSTFTKSIEELSEGIQILREYMFFNNFNFLKQCQLYDKLDLGKLAIPKFETALKKATFKFGDKHIQDIIHDAPKSRKGEIMYRQLNLLLTKGEKPKSRLTAKAMLSPSNSLVLGGESPKKEGDNFESILAQFFALKTLHDFQHFDLNNVDITLLQQKNKPQGTPDEITIKNIYASNNLALIENFQTMVASKIYDVLVNQEKLITNSEQVLFGLTYYLKKAQHETYSAFTQVDLQAYLHKFNITLTLDETDFLYFLIYAGFGENVLNLKCTALWVQAYHNKRLKHVFQTSELLSNMPTALFKRIDIPPIYQDIIKIIQEIGFEKIETALNHLETYNGVSFENFQRFLRQYNIHFTADHFSQFKLWLAQEGVLEMSFNEDLTESKTFIVLNRLLNSLRKTCQDLHIPVTLPVNANFTLESAVSGFNRKVLQTYWQKIEDNILVFSDSFRMISELKIREILKDMVHGLDNTTLNKIFASFKFSEEISPGTLQKRVFVDEFLAKVRDINFDPMLVPPKRPEQKPPVEPLSVQNLNLNLGGHVQKVGIQPEDTDPKRVLGKLEKVLDDLMKSPSLYVRPEERNIPTLPLLKIFESYDNEKRGYLEKKVFKQVLVESFPIFNQYEVDTIVSMADRMSYEHEKGQTAGLNASGGNQMTHISYYYFLLQIEKYFELNKICQKQRENNKEIIK